MTQLPQPDYAALAAEVLLSCRQAVMATHSTALPGYPFTSVVPIACLPDGRILTLLSELAQHTRNVVLDSRVSLLFHDDQAQDWQAAGRLSVMGKLEPLPIQGTMRDQARASFFRLHPQQVDYDQDLDFTFWVLSPMRYRLIGGFARIKWLDHIDPGLIGLDDAQRQRIEQALTAQYGAGQLLDVSRYGVQWLRKGRLEWHAHPPAMQQATTMNLLAWLLRDSDTYHI